MPCCVAIGCANHSNRIPKNGRKKITFHIFPHDEGLRNEWIRLLQRDNWQPTQYSRLCCEHFEEQCFDRSSPFRVYLKTDSVPTIFPGLQNVLQPSPSKGGKRKLRKQRSGTPQQLSEDPFQTDEDPQQLSEDPLQSSEESQQPTEKPSHQVKKIDKTKQLLNRLKFSQSKLRSERRRNKRLLKRVLQLKMLITDLREKNSNNSEYVQMLRGGGHFLTLLGGS